MNNELKIEIDSVIHKLMSAKCMVDISDKKNFLEYLEKAVTQITAIHEGVSNEDK